MGECDGKDIWPFRWHRDARQVWLWRCHCCRAVSTSNRCRNCGQHIEDNTW